MIVISSGCRPIIDENVLSAMLKAGFKYRNPKISRITELLADFSV